MSSSGVQHSFPVAVTLLLSFLFSSVAAVPTCPQYTTLRTELSAKLSNGSSISNVDAPRWSNYEPPQSQFIINVACEEDVATSVKYCNQQNLTFVTQNGGNGWADTFKLGECGVIINIEGLNSTTFNADKTEATIGGGVRVASLVNAGYANNARFATSTCNCLGFLGAALGGGLTRSSGLYGNSVDQLLSANLVTASGDIIRVDPSNDDLWWALKGAAPNFGIITSAVIKSYPVPQAENIAWKGALIYTDDQLEAVVSAVDSLYLEPQMQIDLQYVASANGSTSVLATPFFVGNTTAGRAAFKPLLDLGPVADTTQELPYTSWNTAANSFCIKGSRKPAYGASVNRYDVAAWRSIYEEFKSFVANNPGARNSTIISENYAVNATANQAGSGSYPWRNVKAHAAITPWYSDESLDEAANAYGQKVRSLMRINDGVEGNANYINFAHGDESLEDIYGDSLPRLQALKKTYDPQNRFNQWFPLA